MRLKLLFCLYRGSVSLGRIKNDKKRSGLKHLKQGD